jgi:REP element-mobilizing transposase RayT
MMRGIERRAIFVDDDDRLAFVERLVRVVPETGTACLAWAFMLNHVHLLLRTGHAPLSRVMARVNTAYAMYFNRRHERVGHLFQNRFRSRLTTSHADVLGVIRYIHRNPLEASTVDSAEALADYPWSSHAALIGRRAPWAFESVREVVDLLGGDPSVAAATLLRWVSEAGGEEATSDPPEAGWTRGSAPVRSRGEPRDFETILADVLKRFAISEQELRTGRRTRFVSDARAALIHEAATTLGLSGAEIGRRLGVPRSSVAAALSRARMLARRSD